MLKKSIKLFGRSVPISVIVLVLAVIGVAAAFLLNYNFTGTVSAASAPIIAYPAGGWQCSIVGLGTVVSCTGTPGATWEVSGINDDSVLTLQRTFENNGSFPVNFSALSQPSSPHIQAQFTSSTAPLAVGGIRVITIRYAFVGLTAGEVLNSQQTSFTLSQ